jgi:hypothetical protein
MPQHAPCAPALVPEQASGELRPADADAAAQPTLVPDSYFRRDAHGPLQGGTPLRGLQRGGGRGEQPLAPDDPDLERLESALHWLQREAAATRFPPPPLLEPERMARPPGRAPRHAQKWLLTALLATAAVPLVYYLSADSLVSASTPVAPSRLATLQQSFDAVQPIGQEETAAVGLRERASGMSIAPSISPPQADIPRSAPTPAVETVALPTPQPAGEAAPRPDTPVRTLDREEIALLVTRGDQLISAGDIAAARTVFQRASDAGDVAASVALAASYDPTALKRLGVVGKHADLEKARSLYERAERLGSAEATRRLHMLARR